MRPTQRCDYLTSRLGKLGEGRVEFRELGQVLDCGGDGRTTPLKGLM